MCLYIGQSPARTLRQYIRPAHAVTVPSPTVDALDAVNVLPAQVLSNDACFALAIHYDSHLFLVHARSVFRSAVLLPTGCSATPVLAPVPTAEQRRAPQSGNICRVERVRIYRLFLLVELEQLFVAQGTLEASLMALILRATPPEVEGDA